jgi:demethylmenaquinone methyltransferase / 2-methoxy-6-polyprenyl-1,4-benzoquinol methylase
MKYGWDHPATAERYEQFCSRHARYREANEHLIAHAAIEAGQSILDIAAGTGRTAEAAVAAGARVACYEPAAAMRGMGMRRLPEAEWLEAWPRRLFDRVLCGAALWQLLPLEDCFERVGDLLRPGGALVFNTPGLYFGVPDEPGGGSDPLLFELASQLADGAVPDAAAVDRLPDPKGIEALLSAAGFAPEPWRFRIRITQAALRDWMSIPVLTDALLGEFDLEARDRRMQQAWRNVDPESWKWETWIGWTAWKR